MFINICSISAKIHLNNSCFILYTWADDGMTISHGATFDSQDGHCWGLACKYGKLIACFKCDYDITLS